MRGGSSIPLAAPIPGVNVSIVGPNLIGVRGTTTGDNGLFRVLALPSGYYEVRISHVAFQSKTVAGVRVPLGGTVTLSDLRLNPRALEAAEIVTSGERPLIDITSTSLGENLTNAQLEGLPLERNYQAISKLLPQANESYYGDGVSVAGATGLETKYFIGGVDVTDPIKSSSSTNLPYNFVREIQVRTSAYEAEYRGSLGGLVNAVTYSGGNEFSGQVYGFFTNNDFAGTPRQGTSPLPLTYRQYDVGGSVGGPIVRDRLWFFGAYNPLSSHEDVSLGTLGTFDDYMTIHAFASKLSWRVDEGNTVHLAVFGDPTSGRMVTSVPPPYTALSADPFLSSIEKGGITVAADGTHILGEGILLESYAAWTRRKDVQEGENPQSRDVGSFMDNVNFTWSGGPIYRFNDVVTTVSAGAKATMNLANHIVKSGIEITDLKLSKDESDRLLRQMTDTLFDDQTYLPQGKVGQTILGVFVQDSWKISSRVRLNAGLRWDPQFLRTSEGKVGQKFLSQFAPRVGVVYLPSGSGTDKIEASAGRFYQMLSMYVQTWYQSSSTTIHTADYDHDPRVDPSGAENVVDQAGKIQAEHPDMKGQHYDEFTLGFEKQLPPGLKLAIRGVYRTLRMGIEDGVNRAAGEFVFGNPGSTPMEDFSKMEREYAALELTAEQSGVGPISFLGSYVLSRTYGNYPGLFDYLSSDDRANASAQFDFPEQLVNATGLTPNDRTHVLKLFGSYKTDFGLTLGASFIWESGIPLSEYGLSSNAGVLFVTRRGTAGRTPTLWDLSFRAAFDLSRVMKLSTRIRVLADLLHVGSPRTAVNHDQIHYLANESGNWISPNPDYGQPVQFQPPMTMRLGLEVSF